MAAQLELHNHVQVHHVQDLTLHCYSLLGYSLLGYSLLVHLHLLLQMHLTVVQQEPHNHDLVHHVGFKVTPLFTVGAVFKGVFSIPSFVFTAPSSTTLSFVDSASISLCCVSFTDSLTASADSSTTSSLLHEVNNTIAPTQSNRDDFLIICNNILMCFYF